MGNGRTSTLVYGVNKIRLDDDKPNFVAMTYQQAINFVKNINLPTNSEMRRLGLNDFNFVQYVIHALHMHDKPIVLPDAEFDKQLKNKSVEGLELHRGTGSERATNSIMFSDSTYLGNGIHGDGIYFSTNQSTAYDYSRQYGVTAFLDKSKARIIDERKLRNMYNSEPKQLRNAFEGRHSEKFKYSYDDYSGISVYALFKGYNVIRAYGGNGFYSHDSGGEDFFIALSREPIVLREHRK